MALGATLYNFTIQLSDMDRNVYETLELRVAQHPSEAAEYLATRVLAYCLEYQDGIAFSKGLADADQPAVWVHDPTGRLTVWIEVGAPTAERLHRASKLAERVVVYTHKDIDVLKHNLGRAPIHQAAQIPLYTLDWRFISAFTARLERRLACALTVTERQVYLEVGGHTLQTTIGEHRLD